MEKRMNITRDIKECLEESPKSISNISKHLKINWRTAQKTLNIMKIFHMVIEREEGKRRIFYLKDNNNYFNLPIKEKDYKLISSIYYHIRRLTNESFNKDPSKTQAYKVIWKASQELNLTLPIGWYRYGPCCVQIYNNDEKEECKLTGKQLSTIKETVEEYCSYDNISLQSKVYREDENKLYQVKESLLSTIKNKDHLNTLLLDLIKNTPDNINDTITDFARLSLSRGWKVTKDLFVELIWPYIALYVFKDSLKEYYGETISVYLDPYLNNLKREIQLEIINITKCFPAKQS